MTNEIKTYKIDLVLLTILFGPAAVLTIGSKTPNLFWADIAVSVFAILATMKWLYAKSTTTIIPISSKFALCYIGIAAISLPLSIDPFFSLSCFKLRFMPLVVFLLTIGALKNDKSIYHIRTIIILFSISIALITLWNWNQYLKGNFELSKNSGLKEMAQTVIGRNNYLASIFALLIPISIGALFYSKLAIKLIAILSVLLLSIAMSATMSRGGLISLLLGLIAWFFFLLFSNKNKLNKVRLFGSIIILLFISFAMVKILIPEKFLSLYMDRLIELQSVDTMDHSAYLRILKVGQAYQYIYDHPLTIITGIGTGNQYMKALQNPNFMTGSTHNLYMEVFLENGLFGLVALLGILGCFATILIKLWIGAINPKERILAGSLIASFASATANACFEPSFWAVQYAYLFWILMAMAYAINKIRQV